MHTACASEAFKYQFVLIPRICRTIFVPKTKRIMEVDVPAEATKSKLLPQKRYYRQRAHSNPIADHTLD